MPNHKLQQGFSLLELILVLVIVGLMMGVAVSALSEGPVLRKTSREVATSLRHARSLAILQQQETVWSMDIQSGEFGAAKQSQRKLHRKISAQINTTSSEVVSNTRGNIRFYPDGSSTGGSIELSDEREQAYTVNVEWISGRVSLL